MSFHSSKRTMIALAFAGVAAGVTASDARISVPVAFGRGLDTAQPGNKVNHAMLPQEVKVTEGGVVHFLMSGFHQLVIYKDGKELRDVAGPDPSSFFINDGQDVKYVGINPAGGPLGTAPTGNPSNASNRVESVSFTEPGTYLVICNVRQHFLDGMHGVVTVQKAGE